MALLTHLRHRLLPLRRHLSSSAAAILTPADPSTPLTSHQKSRAALSLLRSATDPSHIASICLAAALTPTSHLDRLSLSLAVSSLASSSSLSTIRSLVHDLLLTDPTPNPRLLSHAIVLFGQAGMIDDAILTFKSNPDLRSLNALLFACILAKKHDSVAQIFRDYPAAHGITTDLETYNTVIKAFCESGSSRSFYSMLDEMVRLKIKPNLSTFSIALAGFYREERFEDVEKVMNLTKKHGCRPGLSIYNVRIQSLCKLKRLGDAMELFKELRVKGMKPSGVTYNHLVFGFCTVGDLEEAKRLYKEMGGSGKVPESSCCFTLIYYLCKGGDFVSAMEVWKESMEKNWVPPFKTTKALVNGLVGSSRIEEAREIIGKVKEKFPDHADMWKKVEEGLPQ